MTARGIPGEPGRIPVHGAPEFPRPDAREIVDELEERIAPHPDATSEGAQTPREEDVTAPGETAAPEPPD